MPIHDYKCKKCNFQDEFIKSFSVSKEMLPPEICPKCGGEMEIQFSVSNRVGLDFIGPGFFVNDYGKKNLYRNLTPAQHASVLLGEKDPY